MNANTHNGENEMKKMMLITKAIEAKIPALYSTENVPTDEKAIAVKFFTPDSNWTWFAVEGSRQEDGDFLFFGLVHGLEKEWGYFSLRELEAARGPMGLPIERDMYLGSKKVKDIS